ncbi:REP-associated tyrosine transposase [Catenovulum adriaticum]|uniref:Transposase n=1 Tax=Catenovulum adriaticum TaxID=2984846 RepID=A0ABY7APE9_9ALTE|nr:transposase [Catenovulum sp. TS8]WAJ70189.1 transposase [Catenovulum sp. TS8]
MPNYKRFKKAGGLYFFTVTLANRFNNDLLIRHIELLRAVVKKVKTEYPFIIHAWCVLPDHMHCVIELPEGDDNFSLRWQLIKTHFSKKLPKSEFLSEVQLKRKERGIWQKRFWEHVIRDETDYWHHINYVHFNPLKHGLVTQLKSWPYSTFHQYVQAGVYSENWCGDTGD